MEKLYSICSFIIFFVSSCLSTVKYDYKFKIEIVDKIESDLDDFQSKYDHHFFQELHNDEQQKLCELVKKFASLDGKSRVDSKYFLKGKYHDNVISCNTVPVAYLLYKDPYSSESDNSEEDLGLKALVRSQNFHQRTEVSSKKTKNDLGLKRLFGSQDFHQRTEVSPEETKNEVPKHTKIIILIEKNPFVNDGRSFSVETAESEPISCLDRLQNDETNFDMRDEEFQKLFKSQCRKDPRVKKSLLKTLSRGQRLHLCEAAKKIDWAHNLVFYDNKVDKPQIFDIEFKTKPVQRVLLKCPTSPSMYLMFKNLRKNKDVQKIFVKTGS